LGADLMSEARFGSDAISHDSYIVFKATNAPVIITYPRTIGGILQESGVVEKGILLKSYLITPDGATRLSLENYFHLLNELIGSKEDTLSVNGNTYPKVNVRSISYDRYKINKFTRFEIDFELNDQDTDGVIRQLPATGLENFNRGRKLTFTTAMPDGSSKTFSFWHNFDNIRNFETQVTIKRSNEYGTGRVIRVGGFEKIICMGWIIGPDIQNRKNLEAYFYNIINGPLGRLGTLYHDGTKVAENCILTEFSMDDSTKFALNYELTFLVSLQC
jgi:hypothetical protein